METIIQTPQSSNPLNVLLIGNNPIEMGAILEKLSQVRNQKITTEIAFDLKSILERLIRFSPNFIFIDDNIGRFELQQTVKQLSTNRKTKDVPITVLKSSNYQEAMGASSILDYLLKQNLSAEALYNTVRNSLRFRRTQLYLNKVYKRRKNVILQKAVSSNFKPQTSN
jgi:DNA-binding response OmpR family regulator